MDGVLTLAPKVVLIDEVSYLVLGHMDLGEVTDTTERVSIKGVTAFRHR